MNADDPKTWPRGSFAGVGAAASASVLLYVSVLLRNTESLLRRLPRDGAVQEQAVRVMHMTGALCLALLLSVVVCSTFAIKRGERRMSLLGIGLATMAVLLEVIVT
jgi:hypothetical protein